MKNFVMVKPALPTRRWAINPNDTMGRASLVRLRTGSKPSTTTSNSTHLNEQVEATERMAVLSAASYLANPAKWDYNTYTAKNGEFTTWLKMKAWLLETYSPVDPINTYHDAFFLSTRQWVGESPDNFYHRFFDAANLDSPQPSNCRDISHIRVFAMGTSVLPKANQIRHGIFQMG
jgi:hypothetical protein